MFDLTKNDQIKIASINNFSSFWYKMKRSEHNYKNKLVMELQHGSKSI